MRRSRAETRGKGGGQGHVTAEAVSNQQSLVEAEAVEDARRGAVRCDRGVSTSRRGDGECCGDQRRMGGRVLEQGLRLGLGHRPVGIDLAATAAHQPGSFGRRLMTSSVGAGRRGKLRRGSCPRGSCNSGSCHSGRHIRSTRDAGMAHACRHRQQHDDSSQHGANPAVPVHHRHPTSPAGTSEPRRWTRTVGSSLVTGSQSPFRVADDATWRSGTCGLMR